MADIPNAHPPNITSCFFLEELADFLYLRPPGSGIKQKVTQFTRVWLNINGSLGGVRIALEDEDLVFGATFLLYGVHCARQCASSLTSLRNRG